jgi:DNA-binding CsgD family transcriptional regulator
MLSKYAQIRGKIYSPKKKPSFDPTIGREERLAGVDWEKLKPRERKVADLLVAGLTHEEIGKSLGIKTGTVREYCYSINRMLGLKGMKELEMALQQWREGG